MKKIILACITLSTIGLVAYSEAQTSDVGSILTKVSGDTLEAVEFNQLLDTARGIHTQLDPANTGDYNIGLNAQPISGVDLNIAGLIKVEAYTGVEATCSLLKIVTRTQKPLFTTPHIANCLIV